MKSSILLLVAVLATTMIATTIFTQGSYAKINTVIIDEHCDNPSGHQAPGQQDDCNGQAQEEVVETENQNPAGHAPPGQNDDDD